MHFQSLNYLTMSVTTYVVITNFINIAHKRHCAEVDETFIHPDEVSDPRRSLLHCIHILEMTIVPPLRDVRDNDDDGR